MDGEDGEPGPIIPPSQIIQNSQATATADATTSSVADVLATGMTLTPVPGTYMVWFNGSVENNTNAATTFMSIYSGGSQVAASEVRAVQQAAARAFPFGCIAIVTVNGAQAIEGRWRVSGNTSTMHQRTLMILKVG
jgi:hypothetical protein